MNKTISIYCKSRKSHYEYPIGTTLLEILEDVGNVCGHQIVSAKVNYKSEDLNFALYKPKDIEFIDITSSSGMRVYIRTLTLILAKALNDIYPDAALHLDHPLSKGYFCNVKNLGCELSEEVVGKIKTRMQEIIDANLPIQKHEKQGFVVIEMFRERKQTDKVMLLETLNRPYTDYHELDGYVDCYNGPLLPSTGHINLFDIMLHYDGILMRLPSRKNPSVLEEMIPQTKMYEVFKEFIEWNDIMGISNVGDFNLSCKEKKAFDLIKIGEALHEKKIAGIADKIISNMNKTRFVMISGPSSSGKTTFSKRLSIQLQAAGMQPVLISLDNYFVDREHTPKDEQGNFDFEHLHAMDIAFFNQQLNQLMAGEEIELPNFSFEHGKRIFRGEKIKLSDKNILLMEGIHALNPELTPSIADNLKFKIYVSALTTISLDNHNWIPTTDNRLLRRIIRDYRYRGYSAQDTISRWHSVREGEDKWIFPYQENADVMFNSALVFELAVLKKYAEPILEEVPRNSNEYTEAHRLLKFLKFFMSVHDREIPPTSLLREFLGGSSFKY